MFESRVVLDGSQTLRVLFVSLHLFESRVVLDGSQTPAVTRSVSAVFESRVVLDGSQTLLCRMAGAISLRVVLF